MQPGNALQTFNGTLACIQSPAGDLQVMFTSCDGTVHARLVRGGLDIYPEVCPDDGLPVEFQGYRVDINGPCIEVVGPIVQQPCPGGI